MTRGKSAAPTTKPNHKRKETKMAKSSTTITGGLGLCQLLTVLFVALKLCDKIDWSWWWVGTVAVAIQVAARVFGK